MVGTETLSDRTPEPEVPVPVDMASLEAAEDRKHRLLDSAAAAAAALMTGLSSVPVTVTFTVWMAVPP